MCLKDPTFEEKKLFLQKSNEIYWCPSDMCGTRFNTGIDMFKDCTPKCNLKKWFEGFKLDIEPDDVCFTENPHRVIKFISNITTSHIDFIINTKSHGLYKFALNFQDLIDINRLVLIMDRNILPDPTGSLPKHDKLIEIFAKKLNKNNVELVLNAVDNLQDQIIKQKLKNHINLFYEK